MWWCVAEDSHVTDIDVAWWVCSRILAVVLCVVRGGVFRRTPVFSKLMWRGWCVHGICLCVSLKFFFWSHPRWPNTEIALLSSALVLQLGAHRLSLTSPQSKVSNRLVLPRRAHIAR